MRAVTLERGVARYAEGSCLVNFGHTQVLVTATLEEKLPPWLQGPGPRLGHRRVRHAAARHPRAHPPRGRAGKQSGRTQEIQRLIGRSLRAVVDLTALGERQITIDCDVLQADGGTRTAAITGAWVALHDCFRWMKARLITRHPAPGPGGGGLLRHPDGVPVLDLDYDRGFQRRGRRQFRADRHGRHRRGPGHRREGPVQRGELEALMALARKGIGELIALQKQAVA